MALVFLGGCATSEPSTAQQTESSRQLIFTRDGAGDELQGISNIQVRVFHIDKKEWSIEIDCVPLNPSSPVTLTVYVYPKEVPFGSRGYIASVLQNAAGSKTGYIHQAGDFYLYIESMNVNTWTVSAYE